MIYTYPSTDGFSGYPGCPTNGHYKTADKAEKHFAVSCPVCEPNLAKRPEWQYNPDEVPLTRAEQLEQARIEREEARNKVVTSNAMAKAFEDLMAKKAEPEPKPRRRAKSKA